MEFGLDKCTNKLDTDTCIRDLEQEGTYKYLEN